MGHFALGYLDQGLSIFPTCSPGADGCLEGHPARQADGSVTWTHCARDKMGKKPLVQWGRFQDVLPREGQVRAWWQKWPHANIALATGRLSGVCVVDLDGPEAMKLAVELGFPSGPSVTTGRIGGRHLYFAWRSSAPTIYAKADGIDFRGHGGYVLLPPDRHALGARYKWAPDWVLDLDDLPELPYWVDERARRINQAAAADGAVFGEGERNAGLASVLGRLRKQGLSQGELRIIGLAINQERCIPPLDDAEVIQIADSVARYEPNPDDTIHIGSRSNEPAPAAPDQRGSGIRYSELRFWTIPELRDRPVETTPWFCRGLVGPGLLTELDGSAKLAGKTTLTLAMIRCMINGLDFVGLATTPTKVVYLTEQTWISLQPELDKGGLLEDEGNLHLLLFHETGDATWRQVVRQTIDKARETGARLIVVDTMAQWSGLKGDQENDSGRAYEAVEVLQEALAEGIGVLLVRHDRKSGGGLGESARGSSAYAAVVDIVLHLTPRSGEKSTPRQRVLEGKGRFGDDTPEQMVIELSSTEPFEYVSLGDLEAVTAAEDEFFVLGVLPVVESAALTREEVRTLASLRDETTGRVLLQMVHDGRVIRVGRGVNKDPYRYYQRVVND